MGGEKIDNWLGVKKGGKIVRPDNFLFEPTKIQSPSTHTHTPYSFPHYFHFFFIFIFFSFLISHLNKRGWKSRTIQNMLVFSYSFWLGFRKKRNRKLFYFLKNKNKKIENVKCINLLYSLIR